MPQERSSQKQAFPCSFASREATIANIADEALERGVEYPVCEEPDAMDQDCYLDTYLDDLSGRALDPRMVEKARTTECELIDHMGVWERIPRPAPNSGIKGPQGAFGST